MYRANAGESQIPGTGPEANAFRVDPVGDRADPVLWLLHARRLQSGLLGQKIAEGSMWPIGYTVEMMPVRLLLAADAGLCAPRQRRIRRPDAGDDQGSAETGEGQMIARILSAFAFLGLAGLAHAAPAVEATTKQATNWHAIIMFLIFVSMTLFIT
jgi:hypothetical protein